MYLYSFTSLQVYSYDFDLQSPPVKAYQLVPGATGILLTDSIIFVISHDDDVDPLAVSLKISTSVRSCSSFGRGGGEHVLLLYN